MKKKLNTYEVRVRGFFIARVEVKAYSEEEAKKDYKVKFPAFDDLVEFASEDVLRVEKLSKVKK